MRCCPRLPRSTHPGVLGARSSLWRDAVVFSAPVGTVVQDTVVCLGYGGFRVRSNREFFTNGFLLFLRGTNDIYWMKSMRKLKN